MSLFPCRYYTQQILIFSFIKIHCLLVLKLLTEHYFLFASSQKIGMKFIQKIVVGSPIQAAELIKFVG